MDLVRHELGLFQTDSRFPTKGTCLSLYSRAVNSETPLNDILRHHYAQSIYSFRAATVRTILDFPASFSLAADVITLDRNYRSTQPILAADEVRRLSWLRATIVYVAEDGQIEIALATGGPQHQLTMGLTIPASPISATCPRRWRRWLGPRS
jgi:hypothetical protein